MEIHRKIVLACAGVFLALWFVFNFGQLATDQDLIIRLVLGTVFSVLILLRRKDIRRPDKLSPPQSVLGAIGVLGLLMVAGGTILDVEQVEWLGIIFLLYACLQWAMPAGHSWDILFSLGLFCWVHPLPGQVFGPIQLMTQKLSVESAERLLHCVNVRVWADGMVLRTGYQSFAVELSCSGLRTAVTVLLCIIGTGAWFRFRWYEITAGVVLGLVQVLVLNILRIMYMVMVAGKMTEAWTDTFLHDTAGIFLLAAIFIVQVEIIIYRGLLEKRFARKEAIDAGLIETEDRATIYAPFWRGVGKLMRFMPYFLVIIAGIGGLAFRGRKQHRVMMIRDVVSAMVLTNPADAERASHAALKMAPHDNELRTQRVQILLLRGKYEQALKDLAAIPQANQRALHVILRAWGMMALGHSEEAITMIDTLPEESRMAPGVSVLRAEFAAAIDDTENVVKNVLIARHSPVVLRRVRALFPYLAARQQWETITKCHSELFPYERLANVLVAIHAHMKENDLMDMGRLLSYGLERWPDEPAFLEYLAALSITRRGSKWEKLFAATLKSNIERLNPDELAVYIEKSFGIMRPDLAWLAYNRLEQIDARDPALFLTPAQFGDSWCTFRKYHVGIPAMSAYDGIDLRRFYSASRNWAPAPLAEELASGRFSKNRKEYLRTSLEEFKNREEQKNLTLYMRQMYVSALTMMGETGRADKQKAEIEKMWKKKDEIRRVSNAIAVKLGMRNSRDAWRLLNQAMEKWTDEPEFLQHLASLAMDQPDGTLEQLFESNLKSRFKQLDADELAAYVENSFQINRPDLAWLAYNRLKEVDPRAPALDFLPLKLAAKWFVFRKYRAGLPARSEFETIDIRELYMSSRDWPEVPLLKEVLDEGRNGSDIAGKYLRRCLEEL